MDINKIKEIIEKTYENLKFRYKIIKIKVSTPTQEPIYFYAVDESDMEVWKDEWKA